MKSVSVQSIAARERRRKITKKTQELGKLVPCGSKMNTAEMLQSAFKYVKYLQAQLGILQLMDSSFAESEKTSCKENMQIVTSPKVLEKLTWKVSVWFQTMSFSLWQDTLNLHSPMNSVACYLHLSIPEMTGFTIVLRQCFGGSKLHRRFDSDQLQTGAVAAGECMKNGVVGAHSSSDCCERVRLSHVECACASVTPKLASLLGVDRTIKQIEGCGRIVPRNFKCGSKM
ncbi:Transcription factor bHLH52 [Hibiscus syriacus]|uniref:Transcription factor bHLH52 n=1 Tax=Hibiscus syriacus TaxID=106335 RepID=A0A6A2YLX5_HIBSY|nr:Transcription factor bHLH52 [Hibiscus syriacus]